MAAEVEAPIFGWRLAVVVLATIISLLVMVLAIRTFIAREEPATSSLANSPVTTPSVAAVIKGPDLSVDVAPLASGDVMVTEVLRTKPPLSSLELHLPPPLVDEEGAAPTVRDLQVDAGDVRVSVAQPTEPGPWNVPLPAKSSEVTLTYRLVGATSRRAEATDRRALVQVRPLAYAAGPENATVVITIDDVVVHNVVCPDVPQDEQLCGRESFGRWETVELPADLSTVVTQVDLPTL